MDPNRIDHIRHNLETKDTDELVQIWQANDRQAWTDEAFAAIQQILESRGVDSGEQGQPAEANDPADDTAQPARQARPGCVTAFAILLVVAAVFTVLSSGVTALLSPYPDDAGLFTIGVTLVLGALYVAVAVGLWRLKNWARIGTLVLLGLNLVLLVALLFSGALAIPALLGLVVNGYCLYWFAAHGEYF